MKKKKNLIIYKLIMIEGITYLFSVSTSSLNTFHKH